MLNEKTKVGISVFTMFTLIVFIVSATSAAVNWKSNISHKIETLETKHDVENKNNLEYHELVQSKITNVESELKAINPAITEIQTDLRWIRLQMENSRN